MLRVIHCESGPFGMGATATGHIYETETARTLCGRQVTSGRWTRRWESSDLSTFKPYDCKRCARKLKSTVKSDS